MTIGDSCHHSQIRWSPKGCLELGIVLNIDLKSWIVFGAFLGMRTAHISDRIQARI
jgi:hypothetical protein